MSKGNEIVANIRGSIKWNLVRSLAESKIVQSSFIWLLIVPAAANLLSKIKDEIAINIFGENLHITTKLPFSWQWLFFAACFFAIANFIYKIFCPEIFKNYKSYSNFSDHGKTLHQIYNAMAGMVWDSSENKVKEKYTNKGEYFQSVGIRIESESIEKAGKIRLYDNARGSNAASNGNGNVTTNNAFYCVHNIADEYNKLAILVCVICYSIGFGCLSIVVYQNIQHVVRAFNWAI